MNLVLMLTCIGALWCDTPVYRYAMYRWETSPYEIYVFNDGEDDPGAEPLRQAVQKLRDDRAHPLNVEFVEIDVTADRPWDGYPPTVGDAWRTRPENTPAAEWRVVVSPRGLVVHQGGLDADALTGLGESQASRNICEELAAAKAGALVLLLPGTPPKDEAAESETTKAAKAAVEEVQRRVATGDARLYKSPTQATQEQDEEEEDEADEEDSRPIETGAVVVYRDDPSEAWLVKCLLGVEPDLVEEQFADQPMVFVAYGRGRVLPPYIGKGVTADNLVADVQFITGACSCTVKDENPGVDLLARYDWETAAQMMADLFGSEEGNESQVQIRDLMPRLVPPPESPQTTQPVASSDATTVADAGAAESASESSDGGETPGDVALRTPQVDPTKPSSAAQSSTLIGGGQWLLGLGVAGAITVLAGAAFLLLRPR